MLTSIATSAGSGSVSQLLTRSVPPHNLFYALMSRIMTFPLSHPIATACKPLVAFATTQYHDMEQRAYGVGRWAWKGPDGKETGHHVTDFALFLRVTSVGVQPPWLHG